LTQGVYGSKLINVLQNQELEQMEDRWLSVDEIGQYLGISSDTVYRWIEKQAMPAHRMGRLWKFKRDEVDEWIRTGGAADKIDKTNAED
jgi:excisionase family DNA binding protein